jgi:hypothetical protein
LRKRIGEKRKRRKRTTWLWKERVFWLTASLEQRDEEVNCSML